MNTSKAKKEKPFSVFRSNRILQSFWTLNEEMQPRNKVTFVREIDASAMEKLREKLLQTSGVKPSFTAIIVKAAAIALSEFPYTNRGIFGPSFFKRLVQFNSYDIAVAVERNVPDAEAVVVVETIYDSNKKTLDAVTQELKGFADVKSESTERWSLFHTLLSRLPVFLSKWILRMPKYSPSLWLKHRGGACFVNSPAKYGIDFLVADMLWPLTVSFGWIKERPFVVKGELAVRKTMPLIIVFDRRIMAGAPAAKFFNRLALILENAEEEISAKYEDFKSYTEAV
ncbi:MAG: dehydrogenase [Candidatus Firestonebacteria bacterium RIFOXYC2_FULL_39_67]|nr:MAG: dehydrogenase [Candidatus Firestonebacteria bacterium RIFOXYD2_FULL_39_29]OGF51803.1 MAG: dehydrogenase [Candidatus Firestonebacteria bacterium RifOxyC12_full_39_7]OGF56416.1 MAG: dehydrogenase [Candidatus Firestonebacteria bacterium RIFOXYC2_FULL_39_67]